MFVMLVRFILVFELWIWSLLAGGGVVPLHVGLFMVDYFVEVRLEVKRDEP